MGSRMRGGGEGRGEEGRGEGGREGEREGGRDRKLHILFSCVYIYLTISCVCLYVCFCFRSCHILTLMCSLSCVNSHLRCPTGGFLPFMTGTSSEEFPSQQHNMCITVFAYRFHKHYAHAFAVSLSVSL